MSLVGFLNQTFPDGYSLIANPLDHGDNRLAAVTSGATFPEGARLVQFDGRSWRTNEFVAGSWTEPDWTMPLGEGALLFLPPEAGGGTHVWTGEVIQGELQSFIPAGRSLRASLVPVRGLLSTDLFFPKVPGTKIFRVDATGQFVLAATCTGEGWEPEEPRFLAAEAFLVEAPHPFVWSRPFYASPPDDPAPPIQFTVQPQSLQVAPGETFRLTAQAEREDGVELRYQWQLDGHDLPDATGPELVVAEAGPEHLGHYWVRVMSSARWAWSALAEVTWRGLPRPRMTIQRDGARVRLMVDASAAEAVDVEFSTDLVNWFPLSQAPGQIPTVETMDAAEGRRFYRARLR